MPRRPRRNHPPAFKAKVALEAIKGEEPLVVIAERFDVRPNLITTWKRRLLNGAAMVFKAGEADLALMAAIDEIDLQFPFYGSRRIKDELRDGEFQVGRQHVSTLMRRMGIEPLYPKRGLSHPHPGHQVYPYLLRNLVVDRPGQVWCADIAYLPLTRGFCYLVAIIDWYSRQALSFRLSNTLEAFFCIEALEQALDRHDAPEIFNTDQGSQFTSEGFTSLLLSHGMGISMDGRGRRLDNVFTMQARTSSLMSRAIT